MAKRKKRSPFLRTAPDGHRFSTRIKLGQHSYLDLYKIYNDEETLLTFWVAEGESAVEIARKSMPHGYRVGLF